MEKRPSLLFLASIFWITIASTAALSCYECNLYLCSRPDIDTEQCRLTRQYLEQKNLTKKEEIFDKMTALAGCHENTATNCKACVKVKTTARRQMPMGEYRYDTVLSKVCAREEPHTKKDLCTRSGPPHASQHVCQCFDDLCNSALHISTNYILTLLTGIMALGHYIFYTQ